MRASDPIEFFESKILIPTELGWKEMLLLPAWIREQIFFSEGVDRIDILNEFRFQIERILRGETNTPTALKEIRMMLNHAGYEAPAGLEETIKDLTSWKRLDVMLETNVAMANGWAQHNATIGNVAYPGMALYRTKQAFKPRNWVARCELFQGRDDVILTGDNDEPMYALSNSPIWIMISRFGVNYPPYDFNSSMWTRPLSYDECLKAGLITEENEDEMFDRVEEGVPETPILSEDILKNMLGDFFKDIAEWKNGVLRFLQEKNLTPNP